MSYLENARKIATIITANEDDIETQDTYLHRYLKMPFEKIIENWVKEGEKLAKKLNVDTVYYPGMAMDVLRVFIYTGCTTLIGCDLVDTSFYPILTECKKSSQSFKNQTELYYVCDTLAKDLNTLGNYLKIEDTQPIKSIEIKKNKMTVKFTLLGKMRTLMAYIGNVNNFTPPKTPDLIFNSSFTLNSKKMAKLSPKLVAIPEEEENSLLTKDKKYITTLISSLNFSIIDYFWIIMNDKELADKNSPLFITKAYLLKELFSTKTFNIYSLN